MPGDTKQDRFLWKLRVIGIGVALVIAGVIFAIRHF